MDNLSQEEIRRLAIARIASFFHMPESSIRGEMILGKDLKATFKSDFRENELDKVYYDILDAANRDTYKKLQREQILINTVQDYCEYMVECYRVNPREVFRLLSLNSSDNFAKAIVDCTKTIELDPKNSDAYYNRGSAKQKKWDLEGAITDYSKAIEIDPKYAYAYYGRGLAKQANGDLEGAIIDYSKAIEIDPKYADAYYSRGLAKRKKGDLREAIADYTRAFEFNSKMIISTMADALVKWIKIIFGLS